MSNDPSNPSQKSQPAGGLRHIELSLRDVHQLFNTMDPAPFHEKDLDDDAAEFILSWAEEFHRPEPVDLILHLETLPETGDARELAENAVHHYFAYRARLNRLEFKRLMKQGRLSLVVGLSFLSVCLVAAEFLAGRSSTSLAGFLKEGLTIVGWVAMWRPLEIYLYEWWPIRRRGQVLDKLSRMPVTVRHRGLPRT